MHNKDRSANGAIHEAFFRWSSVPHVTFVVGDSVFGEEHPVFVLKGFGTVVFLLISDVREQGVEVGRPDRESAIAALPGEVAQFGRLCFQPFRRRGFQFLDERRERDGARKSNGDMDMIGNAANERTIATGVSRHGCEVSVKSWAKGRR